jgi:hypothetical protein
MTTSMRRRLTGCLAALLLALGFAVLTAQPAVAVDCANNVVGDINGDGHADAAIGEPGRVDGSGAVHILYGTQDGLVASPSGTARDDQLFTQDSAGVPGSAEAGDGFGEAVALADFNGDKCADLAVGTPGENSDTGFVIVLYGSPTGITTAGADSFTENSLFGSGGRAGEDFGYVLSFGDLNDDGFADLAVGSPGEDVGGATGAGGVVVIYGSASGLDGGAIGAVLITQDTAGVPGAAEDLDDFGAALATGDFDGGGVADLAVGVPGENTLSGLVTVLPGVSGSGVDPTHATAFSQNSTGVPGSSESGDSFGFALAAGDVTGDGRADLAVGAPGENGEPPDPQQVVGVGEGAVNLLLGSATGLTGTGGQIWSQDSAGVEGVAVDTDQFGFALTMGPLDNGGLMDLAIGTPSDSIGSIQGAGSVTILLGSSTGFTTAEAGGLRISQDSPGLAGNPEPGDSFGFALAAPLVQTVDEASLLIGVPAETVNGVVQTGLVHQLATNEFGPNTTGSHTFDQSTPGLQGEPAEADLFGLAVG